MLMSSVSGNFNMGKQPSEHEHAITYGLIQQLEFDDQINDFTEGQKWLVSLLLCSVLSCA